MEAEAVTKNKQKNSPCKTENPKYLTKYTGMDVSTRHETLIHIVPSPIFKKLKMVTVLTPSSYSLAVTFQGTQNKSLFKKAPKVLAATAHLSFPFLLQAHLEWGFCTFPSVYLEVPLLGKLKGHFPKSLTQSALVHRFPCKPSAPLHLRTHHSCTSSSYLIPVSSIVLWALGEQVPCLA